MANLPDLEVPLEKVCFVIVKAREFDGKDVATDVDSGSNATDDEMRDVLEDLPGDPTLQELAGFIAGMNDDERLDLVTLMWLGRDDGSVEEWESLRQEAARSGTKTTARYLLGTPLLGDYLEAGLAKLDLSCTDAY